MFDTSQYESTFKVATSPHFVKIEMVWMGGIYFNTTATQLFLICQKYIYCFHNCYFPAIFYNWHTQM